MIKELIIKISFLALMTIITKVQLFVDYLDSNYFQMCTKTFTIMARMNSTSACRGYC
jgi:hypothetical protein